MAIAYRRTRPSEHPDFVKLGFDGGAVEREGLEIIHPGARGLDFLDPWGNHFQVVAYEAIQFERSPGVKRKLGIEKLGKSEAALREIDERGLA